MKVIPSFFYFIKSYFKSRVKISKLQSDNEKLAKHVKELQNTIFKLNKQNIELVKLNKKYVKIIKSQKKPIFKDIEKTVLTGLSKIQKIKNKMEDV